MAVGERRAASFPRKLNLSQVSCAAACTRRIGDGLFPCGWSLGAGETRGNWINPLGCSPDFDLGLRSALGAVFALERAGE